MHHMDTTTVEIKIKTAGKTTCEQCSNALFQDYGYSNYTTEGTDFVCMVNVHPDGEFDRWYNEDQRLNWARWCISFEAGDPLFMDVDMEALDQFTPDERARWDLYQES